MTRLGTVLGAAVNVQQRPGGVTESEPTWLAGVSFDATDALRLHASATRKIRVPSIDQLFNTSSGNPDLRAEHAYGVDAGADYRLGTASSVGVSVFSTHARDFIERRSGTAVREPRPVPVPRRGADGADDAHSAAGAARRLQLSRLGRRDADGTQPLQTRPRHRGSLEWMWTPIAGSAVRGAVYQTGSQLYDSRGAHAGAAAGRRLHAGRSRIHADAGAPLRHRRST